MAKTNKYLNDKFIKTNNILLKNKKLSKTRVILYYLDRILCFFISKPKKGFNNKKRVLIIFNLALGDGVVFLCSLKNIRKLYPKKDFILDIACQKGLESMYIKTGYFDNVIPLNFTKGTININERFKIIRRLNKDYYDLLLDPIGANDYLTNVLMSRNVKSNYKIGAIINSIPRNISKHILNKTYNEIKTINSKSLIEQYYEFFYEKYNVEYCSLPVEKIEFNIPKEYYIVFPSASSELKRWPTKRYAQIIQKIYAKTKYPLLICGTNSDKDAYDELLQLIDKDIPVINILGKTNLLSFFNIVKNAKFVITNDTSTYHIAVVSQTPVAIITGGYTYDRYVKYEFKNNKFRPYIITNKMECFNCYNNCHKLVNNKKVWPCLDNVTVDYAWNIIEDMINREL